MEDSTYVLDSFLHEIFGGAYIYRHRLVVLLVESGVSEVGEHFFIPFLPENATYRFVEFSYAQLRTTQDAITDAIAKRPDNCNYSGKIWSYEIVQQDNRVRVEYIANSMFGRGFEYFENQFRRYIYDSPMLDFRGVFFLPIGVSPQSPYFGYLNLLLATGIVWGIIGIVRWCVKYKNKI